MDCVVIVAILGGKDFYKLAVFSFINLALMIFVVFRFKAKIALP